MPGEGGLSASRLLALLKARIGRVTLRSMVMASGLTEERHVLKSWVLVPGECMAVGARLPAAKQP